ATAAGGRGRGRRLLVDRLLVDRLLVFLRWRLLLRHLRIVSLLLLGRRRGVLLGKLVSLAALDAAADRRCRSGNHRRPGHTPKKSHNSSPLTSLLLLQVMRRLAATLRRRPRGRRALPSRPAQGSACSR